jgi:peptidoglycan-N-acetylglucosamine deacetylase
VRPLLATFGIGKLFALALSAWSAGGAIVLWFALDAWLAYQIFTPHAQQLGPVLARFATDRREVWLTIDDGPDPHDTPRLIEALARFEVRATFFVIGEQAAAHPELIRALLAAGHEVAHHTHTHPLRSFWAAGPGRTREEIEAGLRALRGLGVIPRCFRAPAGIKSVWLHPLLERHGLTCIGWTRRGFECRSRSPAEVAARVTAQLRPGAILLLHQGSGVPGPIRVTAITHVLQYLRDHGYHATIPRDEQLRPHARAMVSVRPAAPVEC